MSIIILDEIKKITLYLDQKVLTDLVFDNKNEKANKVRESLEELRKYFDEEFLNEKIEIKPAEGKYELYRKNEAIKHVIITSSVPKKYTNPDDFCDLSYLSDKLDGVSIEYNDFRQASSLNGSWKTYRKKEPVRSEPNQKTPVNLFKKPWLSQFG